MVEHYDAFISYRHCSKDSKVAEEIQKSLEHYHVPKKIRQLTGKKKIERIFRDKGELPVTSDLNNDIMFALKNSDYLIVICSAESLESPWVAKEREYFLKHHPKNHILTVLSEGDPREVVPKELCVEEQTIQMEDGSKKTIQKEIEPLSCDYRMPLKKAKKVELPRLVATLLGCSYDELVQRQRQYALRRMAVMLSMLFLLMASFSAYLFWSRTKIQQNLEQAKKNQSQYLAKESEKSLEENDRYTAIQLALAALPGKNEDRPIMLEAESVLEKAVNAYKAPGSVDGHVQEEWTAVNRFGMEGEVKDFEISNEKWLLAYDERNIKVWNLENLNETYSYRSVSDIQSVAFLSDTMVLIVELWDPKVYDFAKQEMVWENEDSQIDEGGSYTYFIADNGKTIVWMSLDRIYIIDALTGEVKQREDKNEEYDWLALSKDSKRAFCYKNEVEQGGGALGYYFDFADKKKSGSTADTNGQNGSQLSFYFDFTSKKKSGKISLPNWEKDIAIKEAVLSGKYIIVVAESARQSEDEEGKYLLCPDAVTKIQCIDAENDKLVWEKEIDRVGDSPVFLACSEGVLQYGFSNDCVAVLYGRDFLVLNMRNGEKLYSELLEKEVIAADKIEWNGYVAINSEGELCRTSFDNKQEEYSSTLGEKQMGFSEAKKVRIIEKNGKKFLFVLENGDSGINLFRTDFYGDGYERFENELEIKGEEMSDGICGKYYVRIPRPKFSKSTAKPENGVMYIYDIEERKYLQSVILEEADGWAYYSLFCSDDGKNVYLFDCNIKKKIMRIEVETGESHIHFFPKCKGHVRVCSRIPVVVYSDKDNNIRKYNMEDETESIIEIKNASARQFDFVDVFGISQNGSYAIVGLASEDYAEFGIMDLNSGMYCPMEKGEDLPKESQFTYMRKEVMENSPTSFVCDEENGMAAVIQHYNQIHIFDKEGKLKGSILHPQRIKSSYFYEGMLLVYSDRTIYRYDASDGKLLGWIALDTELQKQEETDWVMSLDYEWVLLILEHYQQGEYRWEFLGDTLFLTCPDELYMIRMDRWKQELEIPHARYSKLLDEFVVRSYKNPKKTDEEEVELEPIHGVFPHYTTEEIVKKGKNFVLNNNMTDTQKEKYGITWDVTDSNDEIDPKELSVYTQGPESEKTILEGNGLKRKKKMVTYEDVLGDVSESYISDKIVTDDNQYFNTGFAISKDGKYGLHQVFICDRLGIVHGFAVAGLLEKEGTEQIEFQNKKYVGEKYAIVTKGRKTKVTIADLGDGSKIIYSKRGDREMEKIDRALKFGVQKIEKIGKEEAMEYWTPHFEISYNMSDVVELQ